MKIRTYLWPILGWILLEVAFPTVMCAEEVSHTTTIMHPDLETRLRWIESFERAPLARMAEKLSLRAALRGSLSLLSYLDYTPSERNQGACGNCWAWAGTGVMEIALNVQAGVYDRLSVQFVNSCDTTMSCCNGGWLNDFSSFYAIKGYSIPWSNDNAGWRDGDGQCHVACNEISTSPYYPLLSITTESILTHGVGQAQAIANIKNVLNQNRAVWFAFFMGAQEDWTRFNSFWINQSEDALWDFDATCGKVYTYGGGGHAVLCVGYNDDNPSSSYWIMLNSWGTTPNRPKGLFRVDMDLNYDCTYKDGFYSYYSLYWQTLDVVFDIEEEIAYVEPSAYCGGNKPCYPTIQDAINAASTRAVIRVAEGRLFEDVTLDSNKDITVEGGWNSSFTTRASSTTVNSLTINAGTVTAAYLVCQ